MSNNLEQLSAIAQRISDTSDPAERAKLRAEALALIPLLQKELRAGRQQDVLELRASGLSDGEIGELLGLHWARVSAIARGVSSGGGSKRSRTS